MEHSDHLLYKRVIETSFDAIVCSNAEGLITLWNPAAERMFGYKTSEILTQPITKLIPAEDQEKHQIAFKHFIATGTFKTSGNIVQVSGRRKDGSTLPIELSLSADQTEQGWSFTAVLRDNSKRVQHDEQVRLFQHQQQTSDILSLDALTGMELGQLFQKTTTLIASTLAVEYCKILELQPDGKHLLLRAGTGWKEGLIGHAQVETGEDSQAGYTLQSNQPVVVSDLRTETRFSGPPLLHDHGIVSGISVIINTTKQPWGVLGCHATTSREFSDDDINFMQVLANILALAIERKQSEEALHQNQATHQEALRIAHLGYIELDLLNNAITCSDETRRIFEFKANKHKLSYASFLKRIHPDDKQFVHQQHNNVLKKRQPYDMTMRLLMPDKRIKWIHEQCEIIVAQNGELLKSMAIVQDITERKKAEKRLQTISQFCATASGESFFSALVSSTAQALDSKIVFVAELLPDSIPTARTLALSIDQTLIDNIEYPLAGTPCEQIIKGNALTFASDLQASFPEDSWLVDIGAESYIGVPMMDDNGHVIGHMGVMDDKGIHDQQQIIDTLVIFAERASAELKQKRTEASLRKLSQAIEYAGESILITDRNGIIEYINPAFTRISGYSAAETLGKTPRILNSGNQDKAFYKAMWKRITSGKIWQGKVIDKHKNGDFYPAMLTIAPIMDANNTITHFVGTHADLTDLDNMEKQFQQAQKMEAIGILVGGIAHDFNNMLAGITGNIFLAKQEQENPHALQHLNNIEKLSFRAADMIKQLLTFARKDRVEIKPLPFTSFIKETLKFITVSIPENITIKQDMCMEALAINGDATQLHQLLMNLINNARDAVEDEPEPCISIHLKHIQPEDAFINAHPYFKAGQYAHLSIEDNGRGIPEHQIEHLFEPFFTTKEQGKGTGLGLAMVFGAVKRHHGFIEVESHLGQGSIFHIYIPLLEQSQALRSPPQEKERGQGQGELILLADDEQQLREITAEVLETIGYRVLQAKDGLEGLELFKRYHQEIKLALLDVVMPHCGGLDLAIQIKEISPDLPILFLTGYDKEHVLDTSIQNSRILSKPIQFDELGRLIQEQLLRKPV